MKPLVIYHDNCADGFGAAFAAWMKLGDEAEYLPMQYGFKFDWNAASAPIDVLDRDVYILDFSFHRDVMEWIFEKANRVIWLDHHKTAFEMWCDDGERNFYQSFCGVKDCYITLDNNKSGAMLAWEYFHPGTEVPMLIRYIDDYDRWQFKLEGTKEFNKGLWSYMPWTFKKWNNLFPEDTPVIRDWKLDDMKREGAAILRAHEQNVQTVVKGASVRCLIQEKEVKNSYLGLAANCPPHLASDVGHELANQSGTYGLLWYINKDGKCLCSLRSNGDYDVSTIAKAFEGGGHKNAAGFEIDIQTLLGWLK